MDWIGPALGVLGGLAVSLGMLWISVKLLRDGWRDYQSKRCSGAPMDPPEHWLLRGVGYVVAAVWLAMWAALPVLLLLAAFGVRI